MRIFLFITLLKSFTVFGQTPVGIADNTVRISARGEEVFYYGLAEGDQLIFSFEEVNGKELKEVEILEFPSASKFMDYKTKKTENKEIPITQTGIYMFRFSNSALGARICKIKLQRIPASEETSRFNTSVYWNILYDTTYTTVQEKYLVKKELKPVSIVPAYDFYVNSGSNATFIGGKSRIVVPVNLPKNTQEWYYSFSAFREKEQASAAKTALNLVGGLSKILDRTGIVKGAIDLIAAPAGDNYCDIYLLDHENSRLFEAKSPYGYFPDGTRENIKSGTVKLSWGAGHTYYIGIKNPDRTEGIAVAIEVVAVVLEEEWGG